MSNLDTPKRMPSARPRGRIWLMLAAVFTGLLMVNVALRMLFIKQGIAIWRLDDLVAEHLAHQLSRLR